MSRPALLRNLLPAIAFVAVAALALPLGRLSDGSGAWESTMDELGKIETGMKGAASFHPPLESPAIPDAAAYCGECHPFPPHPGEGVEPTILNQHAAGFECLVCHWSRLSGEQPDIMWASMPPQQGKEKKLYLKVSTSRAGSTITPATEREKVLSSQVCFDRGPKCRGCHQKGKLDKYARPTLTPHRKAKLERLPDFFSPNKDGKWYFQ